MTARDDSTFLTIPSSRFRAAKNRHPGNRPLSSSRESPIVVIPGIAHCRHPGSAKAKPRAVTPEIAKQLSGAGTHPKWEPPISYNEPLQQTIAKPFSLEDACRVGSQPCVYILTNQRHGTLYVGVTSNLAARIWTHREELVEGFTKQYRLKRLVYFECYDSISDAIRREKQLKRWRRLWKIRLIEGVNPGWRDLYETLA